MQYSIFGYLKGLGKYVIGCNPKSRYRYAKSIVSNTKHGPYKHKKVKVLAIEIFKKNWKAGDLSFSSIIREELADMAKIDDIADCYLMLLYFLKHNTTYFIIE